MVSPQDFEKALTPRRLLPMAMIPGTMATGILVVSGLCAYFHAVSPAAPSENSLETARLFSLFHAPIAAVLFFLSGFLPQRLLLTDALRGAESAEALLNRYQTAMILRLGFAEGAALFGGVVCFLAAHGGVLRVQPLYWINLLSAAAFFWVLLSHWPSAARLKDWHRATLL